MPLQLMFNAPGYAGRAVVLNGQLYANIPRMVECGGTSGDRYQLRLNGAMIPCTWSEFVAARPNAVGRSVMRIDGHLFIQNAMRLDASGRNILRGGVLGRTRNTVSMGPGWFNEDGSWHFEPASATATFDALGIVEDPGSNAWTDSAARAEPGIQTVGDIYDAHTRHYIDGGSYPPYPDEDLPARYQGQFFRGQDTNNVFARQWIYTTARRPFFDNYGGGWSWNTGPLNALVAGTTSAIQFVRK